MTVIMKVGRPPGRTVKPSTNGVAERPKKPWQAEEVRPMTMYIGLDVHSKQTTWCAQDEAGRVIGQGSVATTVEALTGLLATLDAPEGTRIGLESGVQARVVSLMLRSAGMEPVVVNAAEVRKKARRARQKTDKRDAFEICDGIRRGQYVSEVYVPDDGIQRLRGLLSRRRHFKNVCTMESNAAKYIFRTNGIRVEACRTTTRQAWEKLLARPEVERWRTWLEMHAAMWLLADEMVTRLEVELAEALEPYREELELLQSAPGVGPVVAATYLATVATPERFATSGHVASYVGLVPSTCDSGERERHGGITKEGSREMRAMLCEAAHHAQNPRNPLNPYFVRVMAKGGYRKAVTSVAHRLACILYQMWKKHEAFDVSKLGVEAGEYTVTKKRFYALKGARRRQSKAA